MKTAIEIICIIAAITGIACAVFLRIKSIRYKNDHAIYTCNGCGKKMTFEQIAYENDEQGDDYCADCNEAIQGDDESAGRKPLTH